LNRYLLDTNHLSAYLDRQAALEKRIDAGLRTGDRFGICLPVLCEYRAGIRLSRRYRQNLARLQFALAHYASGPATNKPLPNLPSFSKSYALRGECCHSSIF
jgi:predicted nucleic acid-binding protein